MVIVGYIVYHLHTNTIVYHLHTNMVYHVIFGVHTKCPGKENKQTEAINNVPGNKYLTIFHSR